MTGKPDDNDTRVGEDASVPKSGPASKGGGTPSSGLTELDHEFAALMKAFDKVMRQEGQPPVAPEMEPELELKLQAALGSFLAKPLPPGIEINDDAALQRALEAHVKPLFDALFGTALDHVKPRAEALKAGKEPPPVTSEPLRIDLSALFEEDDEPDDDEDPPR